MLLIPAGSMALCAAGKTEMWPLRAQVGQEQGAEHHCCPHCQEPPAHLGSQERPPRGGHEGAVQLARWRWWALAAGWLESRSVRRPSLAKEVDIAWGCLQVEVDLRIGPQLAMT